MNKHCSSTLVAIALVTFAGHAAAQSACENLRVNVRNTLFQINGLDAFCTEFDKMKADLASMKSALSNAHAENALLSARLAASTTPGPSDIDRDSQRAGSDSRTREE